MKSVAVLLFAAWSAGAAEVPVGTRLEIRIRTRIASNASRPHDLVDAVVIKPVMSGERFLIPYMARLQGEVESAQASDGGRRAVLRVNFHRLAGLRGSAIELSTRLVAVDNARETVDANGAIQGIIVPQAVPETLSPRVGANADILQMANAALAGSGGAEIVYEPGVEMTVELLSPVSVEPAEIAPLFHLQPFPPEPGVDELVNSQPPGADLLLIGSRQQVQEALSAAGWRVATTLNKSSPREAFRDIVDGGFQKAPEPAPMLDGRAPEFDYRKQYDTIVKRHRLSIWLRPAQWQGQDVWIAATNERAKVVADLVGAGAVKSVAFPEGKMAVLALRHPALE